MKIMLTWITLVNARGKLTVTLIYVTIHKQSHDSVNEFWTGYKLSPKSQKQSLKLTSVFQDILKGRGCN